MTSSEKNISLAKVQILDSLRNFFSGSLVPITEVILMLFLIKHFNATTLEKTSLAIALKSGYLIALPISFFLLRRNFSVSKSLSGIFIICIAALSMITQSQNVWFLVFLALFIAFPLHGTHSLTATIYSAYPKKSRASRFAWSNISLMLGSIFFSIIFNELISETKLIENKQIDLIVIVTTVALILAALFSYHTPVLKSNHTKEDFKLKIIFNVLKQDKLFTYVLFAWMLLGFSNLWLLPYRTNILVEERFGFSYSESTVLLLLVVIPELVYIIFSIPLGMFFDRANFILLRIMINLTFMLYYIFFFFGDNLTFHILGSVCFGLARSGGNIAWKMWINKMVEKEKVALYMSIHSGTTGIRMVLAPMLGLVGLYQLGPTVCGIISIVFMSLSIILFIPLLRYGKVRFTH